MSESLLPWLDVASAEGSSPRTVDAADQAAPLSEVVGALSCALDITEGQPEGHALRTCMIGMKLAERMGLSEHDRSALFYALQLKDLGCSSNAARVAHLFAADDRRVKKDFKTTDWPRLISSMRYAARNVAPHGSLIQKLGRFVAIGVGGPGEARTMVKIRCERGAAIASMFGLPRATAQTIRDLDEHWNGRGHPEGLRGEAIFPLARVASVAQTVEVFLEAGGLDAALDMAKKRQGKWFDPAIVKALLSLRNDTKFWAEVTGPDILRAVAAHEPPDLVLTADAGRIDRIALGFGQVVDAKSPWTQKHSEKVSELAVGIGRAMGMDDAAVRDLRHAALLHDIGKLGVSNAILDKPGGLTDDEVAAMRMHPAFTHRIMSRVRVLSRIADVAASHHERLDGKGYHRGLTAKQLSKPARALVVADMCEAISAERPYRDTIPMPDVLEILDRQVGSGVCPEAFEALKLHLDVVGYTPSRWSDAPQACAA